MKVLLPYKIVNKRRKVMERDRYQQDKPLFFVFIISLVIALTLLAFAIYIFPPMVLEWKYDIPEFTFTWREWFKQHYEMYEERAGLMVFLIFFVPGIIASLSAYFSGKTIEDEVQGITKATSSPVREDINATASFSLKLLSILIALVLLVFLAQRVLLRV